MQFRWLERVRARGASTREAPFTKQRSRGPVCEREVKRVKTRVKSVSTLDQLDQFNPLGPISSRGGRPFVRDELCRTVVANWPGRLVWRIKMKNHDTVGQLRYGLAATYSVKMARQLGQ